jgi:phosphatidylserine decarboxylase
MLFAIIVILLVLILFFYRSENVKRCRGDDDKTVKSPAYGTVMDVRTTQSGDLFVAIFLSPLDIHHQYAPVSGVVTSKVHDDTGKFELAYELNKSSENEKVITTIENNIGTFKVLQIAGMFVRRISNPLKVGDTLRCGDPMGMIHFGSRVDIFIPHSAYFNAFIKIGAKLRAGDIIGTYI